MGLFQSSEEKIAYEIVREAVNELFEVINLDPRYFAIPKVKVREMIDSGQYSPAKKGTVYLSKNIIGRYKYLREKIEELDKRVENRIKRLEKLYKGYTSERMERSKESQIESIRMGYTSLIRKYKEELERYRRNIKGLAVHEIVHNLRYVLHPEKEELERFDPERRKAEDAIANLTEAIMIGMNREEIIKRIKKYTTELLPTLYKSTGDLIEMDTYFRETIQKVSELLGGKVSERERKEIEKRKMVGRTIKEVIEGYKLGLAVALAIKDLPKEVKLSYLKRFIKSDNPKEILEEMERLKKKAIEENPEIKPYLLPKKTKDLSNYLQKLKDLLLISSFGISLFFFPISLLHSKTAYIAQVEPTRSFFAFILTLLLSSIILLTLKIYSDYKS